LWKVGQALLAAEQAGDAAAFEAARQRLAAIGKVVAPNYEREQQRLQSLGYRGMSAHWLLLQAMIEAQNTHGK
jgi:hypothetical protein